MVMFLRIVNCVTMKLIRLQVRQGQLQLSDVGVFDLLKSQGLRKYKPVSCVLLGHSISSSAISCCSRQISPIGVKDQGKMKIPGCSPMNTVSNSQQKSAWVLTESIIKILAKIPEDSHYSPLRRKFNSFEFIHAAFRNVRSKCKLCSD